MDNILLKYNSLDPASKKQVRDYIDRMIVSLKSSKKKQSPYKERILSASIWSEDDLKPLQENHPFNQFKPEEW
jgi:hypothetical protein